MKFIQFVFSFCFLVLSSFCHAEGWFDCNNIKDMETDEFTKFVDDHNRKFMIPTERSKIGFKISAFDMSSSSITSVVSLRYVPKKVDYHIILLKSQFVDEGTIFLELLDEDEFLIREIRISKVVKDYTGELRGNFDMEWDTFKNVMYYRISMKG